MLYLEKVHRYLKIFILFLIGINIVFASWYVLHKDIYFFTDIARDFSLLQEIDQKKIIFVGPRSSTSGLFHGPLWLYLNYPAYKIGHGNPVVVGWFWILLIIAFLASSFVIAKKLFTETTAYLYILLLSVMLIFEAKGLFNPHGAFFLLPAFFYFFIRYIEKFRMKTVTLLLFIGGCILQFQMAIGIPLLFLATLPILYFIFKKKKYSHLLCFFILLIPLSTFILFDLRHKFMMLHTALTFAFGNNLDRKHFANYFAIIIERAQYMFINGPGFIIDGPITKTVPLIIITISFIYFQIHQNRNKKVYLWGLYFYAGYYFLTIINKSGGMLYQYYMPFFAITYLLFTSLITSKYKKLFIAIFILVYMQNVYQISYHLSYFNSFSNKNPNSWAFLSRMANSVYSDPENEFGYFLYSPDTLAYQEKYAMSYARKVNNKNGYYFQKKTITYIVVEPPPEGKPQFDGINWTQNQVRIKKPPKTIKIYPNGFKIEKYELSAEETKIGWDSTIDTGIQFR